MALRTLARQLRDVAVVTTTVLSLIGSQSVAFARPDGERETRTPIKHVIIIIGENRTFDHIFATYKPVNKNEKVLNLLSKGIVKADGAPGAELRRGAAILGDRQRDLYNWRRRRPPYATLPPAHGRRPVDAVGLRCARASRPATRASRPPTSSRARRSRTVSPTTIIKYLLTGGTGQTSRHARHSASPTTARVRRPAARAVSSSPRRPIPTTPTRRARCTASTRCGSSSTATRAARHRAQSGWGCRADSFPGSK